MGQILDSLAGFKCPNCRSGFHWKYVRELLWRNRVWTFFLPRGVSHRSFYTPPERSEVRCHDCLMDLRLPKLQIWVVEGVCWCLTIALFIGGIVGFREFVGVPEVPLLSEVPTGDIFRRGSEYSRAQDARRALAIQVILISLIMIPLYYFIARFVSYRFVRLEREL